MTSRLQVEVVPAEALDAGAIALWTEWVAADPDLSSPYFNWAYTEIAARVCPGAAVAVFRRDGEIVGFFPHQRRRGQVHPLGAPMNDYHGVIAAPGEEISLEMVAGLLKARTLNAPSWVGRAEAGDERATVQVVLPDGDYAAWYSERRETFGKYFKDKERARRSLSRDFGEIEVQSGLRDPALLDQLIALKAAQYRRSGLHDIFACGWTRDLLHALMADRREGFRASMAVMRAGERVLAMEYSLYAGRTCHFWFPVYDTEVARCSPGILLSMDTMQAAGAEGFSVFDFGFEGESYKKYFVNARRTVREAVVREPGPAKAATEVAAGLLGAVTGRGDDIRTSLRRRLTTIEACEITQTGRMKGVVRAARSAVGKVTARQPRSATVAHV